MRRKKWPSEIVYRYRGYEIRRGDYVTTSDNRIDRWYIDSPDSAMLDRRGPGYRTIQDARDAIRQLDR